MYFICKVFCRLNYNNNRELSHKRFLLIFWFFFILLILLLCCTSFSIFEWKKQQRFLHILCFTEISIVHKTYAYQVRSTKVLRCDSVYHSFVSVFMRFYFLFNANLIYEPKSLSSKLKSSPFPFRSIDECDESMMSMMNDEYDGYGWYSQHFHHA